MKIQSKCCCLTVMLIAPMPILAETCKAVVHNKSKHQYTIIQNTYHTNSVPYSPYDKVIRDLFRQYGDSEEFKMHSKTVPKELGLYVCVSKNDIRPLSTYHSYTLPSEYEALEPTIAIYFDNSKQLAPIYHADTPMYLLSYHNQGIDTSAYYANDSERIGCAFLYKSADNSSAWGNFLHTNSLPNSAQCHTYNNPYDWKWIKKTNKAIPCNGTLHITIPPDESIQGLPNVCSIHGDPIDSITGKVKESVIDYQSHALFPLTVQRHYESDNGWSFNYQQHIFIKDTAVKLYRPEGLILNKSLCHESQHSDCVHHENNQYHYTFSDGITEFYNQTGQLIQRLHTSGLRQYLTYGQDSITIKDDFNRELNIHIKQGSVANATLPNGSNIDYQYDKAYNLTQVTYPNNTQLLYTYHQDKQHSQRLTSLSAQNENLGSSPQLISEWAYDIHGKAIENKMMRG